LVKEAAWAWVLEWVLVKGAAWVLVLAWALA
jgi:hypothetical protein